MDADFKNYLSFTVVTENNETKSFAIVNNCSDFYELRKLFRLLNDESKIKDFGINFGTFLVKDYLKDDFNFHEKFKVADIDTMMVSYTKKSYEFKQFAKSISKVEDFAIENGIYENGDIINSDKSVSISVSKDNENAMFNILVKTLNKLESLIADENFTIYTNKSYDFEYIKKELNMHIYRM